jgi:predicted CoA-binding protein
METHTRFRVADDGELRAILERTKTIAVVGASTDPWRASFGITAYLIRAGYRVFPINPTQLGQELHGRPIRASLQDVPEPIDLVNVFRRPEFIPDVVEDAIAVGATVLWLQLGIRHVRAAERAEEAGIRVVTDRCISVDHRRLIR